MRRLGWPSIVAGGVTVTVLLVSSVVVRAQANVWETGRDLAPILVSHPTLLASVERIGRGSALWREAVGAIRAAGRRVLVATPDEVSEKFWSAPGMRASFDSGALAEVVPVLGRDLQVPVVVVVVNLQLVSRMHEQQLSLPRDFEADLDRIVVHEVYGHAFSYLIAGDLSGRCADPKPGERAAEACAIRRENAVRSELGLGRRTDEGVFSLTLAGARLLPAGLH
jgi:hypothetical protein